MGVIVTHVDPLGVGANALRPGDVILKADNRPISSPAELLQVVSSSEDVLRFLVQRGGRTIFVAVETKS